MAERSGTGTEPARQRRKTERITAEFTWQLDAPLVSPDSTPVVMPLINVLAYGPDKCEERQVRDPGALIEFLANYSVTWIQVDPLGYGPGAQQFVERFGKMFSLHELELEDLLNVHQRAKVEEYGGHLFVVTRMLVEADNPESEQLSLFVGKNFVVSFREIEKDCLDTVREKIKKGRGRIRNEGSDYLMYAIIDAVVDSYFPLITKLADRLEKIEDEVLEQFDEETPARVYELRRDIISIRKAVWPAREALSTLYRDTNPLISDSTRLYLRDCYDHAVRIIDFVEMYREVASALMEVHYTRASNRLNEVMKVLTIITTVFIPPTFIAGVYGMNFNHEKSPLNMPELDWYWGYPFAIFCMLVMSIGLLVYLYVKGYLSDRS